MIVDKDFNALSCATTTATHFVLYIIFLYTTFSSENSRFCTIYFNSVELLKSFNDYALYSHPLCTQPWKNNLELEMLEDTPYKQLSLYYDTI